MSEFDVSSFVASFFDEAKDRLAMINQRLVALEGGELDEEGMTHLRRDAHTIKGSALMLGVNDVGDMAHLFEDAIEALMRHPEFRIAEMVQFLYDVHDQLAHRLAHPDAQEPLDVPRFRTKFDALCEYIRADLESDHAAFLGDEAEAAAETPLIGAEDAEAWQRAGADRAAAEAGDGAAPGLDAEDLGGFRPDLSRLSMLMPEEPQGSGRFLRVDADRLDMLSNQVMELTMAKSRFSSMVEGYEGLARDLRGLRQHWRQLRQGLAQPESGLQAMDEAFAQALRRVRRFGNEMRYEQDRNAIALNDIRDQILGLMLRPLDSIFSTFPRAVRDAAVREHKRVRLQVAGQSVEMDQGVAESLVEPLVHLLNNAIAHGIETPEERRQAGKPEEGMISILAEQSGNEVHIEVLDDGRGIDIDRIREVAVAQGVTTGQEAAQMDTAEILEMIFRPGFSTHADVDPMAGRGMGMNAVQDTLRRLTGSVRIHTEKGRGTCFSLSLPVSITVQRSLQFRIGDHRFGMLTHLIEQVTPLDRLEMLPLDDRERGTALRHVRYEGQPLPLVDLRHVLERRTTGMGISEPHVIIAKHIEGFVGIVVDELLDESEIIVRDIDPYLKRYQVPGLMGNSIVSDSQVLLLIEPYGIKEMGRTAPAMAVQEQYLDGRDAAATPDGPRVLLVEDSLIAREVEKKMLQEAGFSVHTAIDGLDALEKVRAEPFALIVTDLEMPRLDGFGLVRQMRGEPGLARMPVLVISTRDSEEDRQRALDAGADAYLIKQQLSREGLAEVLNGLLHH